MVDPRTALLVFGTSCLVLILLFWPQSGIISRIRRARLRSRRVILEDALKHLHECEYTNITPSRQSIAGALGVTTDDAAGILSRLSEQGLVIAGGEGIALTTEGREYALRVIRMHRLWERYLADKTGIKETEWHSEAEWREHFLTTDEANELSAELGHPRFDPHGDPIPTRAGDLPQSSWRPLTTMHTGELARILHIEDEPRSVYLQIVEEHLATGVQIRMIAADESGIRIEAEGRTIVLSTAAAANIGVSRMMEALQVAGSFRTLADLHPGEAGRVLSISHRCRGMQRRRLMDLGIVPGTLVTAELRSPGGDPTAYRVRGASIALRATQAALIRIDTTNDTMHRTEKTRS